MIDSILWLRLFRDRISWQRHVIDPLSLRRAMLTVAEVQEMPLSVPRRMITWKRARTTTKRSRLLAMQASQTIQPKMQRLMIIQQHQNNRLLLRHVSLIPHVTVPFSCRPLVTIVTPRRLVVCDNNRALVPFVYRPLCQMIALLGPTMPLVPTCFMPRVFKIGSWPWDANTWRVPLFVATWKRT